MRIIKNFYIKFWSSERNTENTTSDLYFNEENDYSEENTYDNEIFRFSILQPFQFEAERKNTCDNETHEKEAKHIHALAANLLYMRIGNPDWCKSGIAKTKREK